MHLALLASPLLEDSQRNGTTHSHLSYLDWSYRTLITPDVVDVGLVRTGIPLPFLHTKQ